MKIFFLISEVGVYPVTEVVDTEGWYLVPISNSFEYEKYSKKLYHLKIQDGFVVNPEKDNPRP